MTILWHLLYKSQISIQQQDKGLQEPSQPLDKKGSIARLSSTKLNMKKNFLCHAFAIFLGLISFSGNAGASNIVFRNLNQTILDGQTFNFGFDGTSITSGTGPFSISYTGPRYYPEQMSYWGTTYPAHTTAPSLFLTAPGYDNSNLVNLEGVSATQGRTAGSYVSNQGSSDWLKQANQIAFSDSVQNQAVWVAISQSHNSVRNFNGWYGWEQITFNNSQATLAAVAFSISGDIIIGDTGNGMYTPVVLQNAPVPEPSALSLLAIGLGGLALVQRRRA